MNTLYLLAKSIYYASWAVLATILARAGCMKLYDALERAMEEYDPYAEREHHHDGN